MNSAEFRIGIPSFTFTALLLTIGKNWAME